jgi:hypothetical protein
LVEKSVRAVESDVRADDIDEEAVPVVVKKVFELGVASALVIAIEGVVALIFVEKLEAWIQT